MRLASHSTSPASLRLLPVPQLVLVEEEDEEKRKSNKVSIRFIGIAHL